MTTIIYRPAGNVDDIVTEHGVAMVAVLDDYPDKVLVMESEQATQQEREYLHEYLPDFLEATPPETWTHGEGMRYVWARVETVG